MQKPAYSPEKNAQLLKHRIEELRAGLFQYDPVQLAARTGMAFIYLDEGQAEFHSVLWDREIMVSYPEYHINELTSGKECNVAQQALLLYYFHTADGTPPGDAWISFTELPDGRFYTQAFQGYTGDELKREFGDDRPAFEQAACALAGRKENLGDAAYSFQLLPQVSLLTVCWLGDEDFPTKYQILFSSNISHYLPTDACAIAGSMLTRRLIGARAGVIGS